MPTSPTPNSKPDLTVLVHNLRHAYWNKRGMHVGGGEFTPDEVGRAAEVLAGAPEALRSLATCALHIGSLEDLLGEVEATEGPMSTILSTVEALKAEVDRARQFLV